MSPVYQPEKHPPKLDRFCYLSHPAQRVMVALYKDYAMKKQELLEHAVSQATASENYYKSIYKSRFGSAPHEKTFKPDKDSFPVKKDASTRSSSAGRLDNEVLTKDVDISNRRKPPRQTKCPNTEVTAQPPWIPSDTSTYSDSPPIETQGYRILSQFQLEDFGNTLDTLVSDSACSDSTINKQCLITDTICSSSTYLSHTLDTLVTDTPPLDSTINKQGLITDTTFTPSTYHSHSLDTIVSDTLSLNNPIDAQHIITDTAKLTSSTSSNVLNVGELTNSASSLMSDTLLTITPTSRTFKKGDVSGHGFGINGSSFDLHDNETSLNMCNYNHGMKLFDQNEDFLTSKSSTEMCSMLPDTLNFNTIVQRTTPSNDINTGDTLSDRFQDGISGSQSLFSQDDVKLPSLNMPKKSSKPSKVKKCMRMQQIHGYGGVSEQVNEESSKNRYERCTTGVSGLETTCTEMNIENDEFNSGQLTTDIPVDNMGDLYIRPLPSPVTIDCRGDSSHGHSAYFYNMPTTSSHVTERTDRSKQEIAFSIGDKLKQLQVEDGNKGSKKNTGIEAVPHAENEFSTDMESPYVTEKTTTNSFPLFSARRTEKNMKESEQKRKMPNSFAVPFKKPKICMNTTTSRPEISTFGGSRLIDLESLSEKECQSALSRLLESEDVLVVLVYRDGSTQLRDTLLGQDSTKQRKNITKERLNNVEIKHFAVSSRCFRERDVFVFPVRKNNNLLRDFWCQLLKNQSKRIGFNVKDTIAAIVKVYNLNFSKVDTSWTMLDPTIGMWLLDPDKPVSGFNGVLQSLCLPEQVPSTDCLNVLYEDMMLLEVAMEKISQKLKSRGMWTLYSSVESKLTTVLAGMEMRSLHIATHTLIKFSEILKKKLKKLEQKAHQAAGHSFLLNSHAQLRQVLFEELCLDTRLPQKTKLAKTNVGREKSTSETVLSQLSPFHELPGIVLEYRQLQKLKSTYIDGILSCIKDEKLYTHWDQTAAATGRLTSYHPNIQAIPKQPVTLSGYRDNYIAGKEICDVIEINARDAFISRPGYSFVAADFQQIELRILAHLADDPVLQQNFNDPDNPDIFNGLTAQWLGKPVDEVTSSEREQTKRVVYSVMYGAGKEKLAEYLKISPDSAKAIMSSFLTKFPTVSQFTKYCVDFCQKNGYTSSIFQRRRLFPNIKHPSSWLRAQAERQCVNFCIQGSAADICKAAMIQIENALVASENLEARLLVQIHDELLLEVADKDIHNVIEVLQDVMQSQETLCGSMVTLKVPIPVSVSVGKSWGQMREIENKGEVFTTD